MKTKSITIEISGKCNAKCPYCAQFRLKQDNHFGEIMSPILFEQILDHLFKIGIINKNDPPTISLFNWGDPFLNPKINDILQILKNKKLTAVISSNFIVVPNIDKKLLSVIDRVTFSLSGFSQASYGRIHGGSLNKVFNNFDNFYESIRKYSPKTKIVISWHRYLFNENEFWDAYKKFNLPGISIDPIIAYLNDGVKIRDFLKGELSEDYIKKAEKDVFLDFIKKSMVSNKKKSKNYYCPQWDSIVIDESGQLLLCCCVTRYDSDSVLGNILDMSSEEILNRNLDNSLCNECISLGIARFVQNPDTSIPSGGGLYSLKWKFYLKFRKTIGPILVKSPYGRKIISIINNL
ncbi:MAG: hypothetical protein L6282_02600 [Candidatus Methanoperedenaceae archaeon]|nr:hypothetical protein [Candidatus Methanoperedenaceae archaeon]